MAEDKNKYVLSINGMSKSFGRNKVLNHINLNVRPGTIMGLMGENPPSPTSRLLPFPRMQYGTSSLRHSRITSPSSRASAGLT